MASYLAFHRSVYSNKQMRVKTLQWPVVVVVVVAVG